MGNKLIGESAIIMLLKECSIKPTPNDFCAHRLVYLWPSAENLLPAGDGQLTQRQVKVQRIETVECSALSEIYRPHLLLRLWDHCGRGGRKNCKSQRWWMATRKQWFLSTVEQLHISTPSGCDSMHKICTSTSQTKSQHERGGLH